MFRSSILFGVATLLALLSLPVAAADTPPAEMKAYSAATRQKEPEKKGELLRAFLKEYPSSRLARSARKELVTSTIKAWPKDSARITSVVREQASASEGTGTAAIYSAAATQLNESGVQPELALTWAKKSVKELRLKDFIAEQEEDASPDVQKRRFESLRAASLDTLGQIEFKAGKAKQAEQTMKQALQANPALAGAAAVLARIADKRGESQKALEYSAQAFLSRAVADNRKLFAEEWKNTHNGAGDGSEEYLDQQYARLFPPVLHVKPYTGKTARTALIEIHTGAGCPPCAGADLAMDALMEHYSRDQVAVVFYHQHIPRPDPMANSDTLARWKFLQGSGVPTYLIDGASNSGGGARDYAESIYRKIDSKLLDRLAVPAGASLKVSAVKNGNAVSVKADVEDIRKSSPDLQLNLALVEKLLRYSGENGIRYHPMVVRSLKTVPLKNAGPVSQAFDVAEVQARLKEHIDAFEKKDERHNPDGKFRFAEYRYTVNAENLAIVAYVEDSKSKEVLQSAYFDMASAPAAAQEKPPISWNLGKPAIEGKPIPGANVKARISAAIADGWHLYSMKKLDGGPIPTTIGIPAEQPFALDGTIEAPEPIRLDDPVFGMEVEFYVESADFTIPVKLASGIKPGVQKLTVAPRFQVCKETLCLPPRTVKLELPVEVVAK